MNHNARLAVVPAFLLLCLLLGGASAAGIWANMLLQIFAILIIFWTLIAKRSTPMSSAGRALLVILGLAVALVVLQLIPLPPELWTQLNGRQRIAEGYELLGMPLPAVPLSLAPHRTIASALWILPAVATLLAILKLGAFKSKWIAWVIAATTTISVALGALQIASGGRSGWYIYEITNYGATTGFFSNANHLATLLVVTIPFLTALYLGARSKGHAGKSLSGMFVILAGALAVVIVGLVINASLAGVGLLVPVAAASALMISSRTGKLGRTTGIALVVVAALSVSFAFSDPFGNNLMAAGAAQSTLSRYTSFRLSLDAAWDFFPFGSGLGSFVEIYPWYEDPTSVTPVYINHVHNDYIELLLETGILGVVVLLLFLAWWTRRLFAVWRTPDPDHIARAASIASAAILLHSLVDYPLRTAAISVVLAACCGLMAEPRSRVRRAAQEPRDEARHLTAD